MSLQPIAEYNPQYFQESSIKNELISRPVFISSTKEEIGTLNDVLVDETGRFRYLVVKAGSWLNERQFLLPAGICRTSDILPSPSLRDRSGLLLNLAVGAR